MTGRDTVVAGGFGVGAAGGSAGAALVGPVPGVGRLLEGPMAELGG